MQKKQTAVKNILQWFALSFLIREITSH